MTVPATMKHNDTVQNITACRAFLWESGQDDKEWGDYKFMRFKCIVLPERTYVALCSQTLPPLHFIYCLYIGGPGEGLAMQD